MSGRRDRSRSPTRVDSHGHRRDSRSDAKNEMNQMMNPMMMANMYPQGNMMMAGGMYPNMMMQNMMGNGMIASTGMEMMQGNGMDLVAQPTMDMSAMATPAIPATPAQPMDMGMMGSMMMDPTMMMYNMANTEMAVVPENKEITLKYCKLTPPDPNTPSPPRRDRPPGCRTIFVGGLPDKIRESIVRDIFEPYGRIHTLRLSKKNFCHIRFDRENSVDPAMLLSGYRIKITGRDKDKDDKEEDDDSHATTGWLHVDFALSRDDQNEYERKQRQALRQQQSQLQQMAPQVSLQQTYRKSPSPVRIQPFSNTAIIQLSEKVKSEDSFSTTLPTLISWLERGECSKKNSNQFYSMIQATNSHIRRLFNEKMQVEEELQECRERTKNHIAKVIEQLEQVAKVFVAATHQRVWDHFTKPQRKNIETWQKMTQDFNTLKEEFLEKFNDEVNEYDYNNGYNNKPLDMNSKSNEEVLQLKSENESLQFQLMAYKNEVDVIKADAQKEMEKFKAQFIARQALQGAMDSKSMQPPLPQPVLKPPPPPPLPDDMDSKVLLKESVEAGCGEAKLIGVISAFLQVHPHGASLDYVVSYVRALFPHSTQATIHHVLQKHNDVFQLTTSGVGANIENKWSFVAFTSKSETATQAVI